MSQLRHCKDSGGPGRQMRRGTLTHLTPKDTWAHGRSELNVRPGMPSSPRASKIFVLPILIDSATPGNTQIGTAGSQVQGEPLLFKSQFLFLHVGQLATGEPGQHVHPKRLRFRILCSKHAHLPKIMQNYFYPTSATKRNLRKQFTG